jgi:predicted ATP-grasp superfamily ATP-dependent carboligase
MMSGPVAVVLGLRENGLGIVRALGRQGVPVIAVDDTVERFYTKTRYARRVACKDFYGTGLIDRLCELGKNLGGGGMLIPAMDQNVALVSQYRHRLETAYRHSLPPAGVVDLLMDKEATRKFAETKGFLMPRSFEVTTEEELETYLQEIEPPYILKPRSPGVLRYGTKKVVFTRSKDELKQAFRMLSQWESGVVLQEWIPGADENLVFALYYFDENTNPLGCFIGRKIRQYVPYCGSGCSAEPWKDDFVSEYGLKFFREIGYTGFGAIEFKISDRDGKHYLVEPSIGRPEHFFALAEANNVNLPYVGYRHMAQLPLPTPDETNAPVRYFNLKNDFRAARTYIRANELTVKGWLRSLRGPKLYAVFAWDDLKPFLSYCTQPFVRLSKGLAGRGRSLREIVYTVADLASGRRTTEPDLRIDYTHPNGRS